jgi:N6-L-threonylcarbamoyladenine synthase
LYAEAVKILAFETSCDDTAVAIVEDGTRVLSNVRVSQIEHSQFGGVVPEIAARLHSENWRGALEKCLEEAQLTVDDVDYIAVTAGPGLQTSLLTGTTAASFLSQFFHKKIIPVQHIRGHINSIILDRDLEEIQFPVLVLTVSGGHTDMFLQTSFTDIKRLGGTLDDAAGEAFDKCAKMLGLGYPGGPLVSKAAESGDGKRFRFPRPYLAKTSFDFSFSGIKAAVYREIEEEKRRIDPTLSAEQGDSNPLPEGGFDAQYIADVCASFEQAVVDVFVKKVSRVLVRYPELKAVHFTGGVSANTAIREALNFLCAKNKITFRVPAKFEYCTDNAAMIAAEAFLQFQKNPDIAQEQFVDANPRLKV